MVERSTAEAVRLRKINGRLQKDRAAGPEAGGGGAGGTKGGGGSGSDDGGLVGGGGNDGSCDGGWRRTAPVATAAA